MAKILLIQPSMIRNRKIPSNDPAIPLGLVYVGTSLKVHNHEVKILDRDLNPSNEYLKSLLKRDYDFVGLGVFTNPMLYDAIDVSKFVKENSNSKVIWGGFHVMSVPNLTFKNQYVDYIMRGESEETFIKLLDLYEKGKNFSKLPGVNLNPLAPPPDINNISVPDYSLLELNKYSNFFISTSRGCPYRCSFCYNSYGDMSIKPYRNINVDKAIELMQDIVYKYKRKTFTIVDDNFPSDKKRMRKICDALVPLDVRFNAFCRANYASMENLLYMKKAGCWQADIGVESGSQRILDLLNKCSTVQMNANAIKNCKKAGVLANCFLMIGTPTETMADLRMTEDFIVKTKPDLTGTAIFYLLPRTKLWDFCKQKGWIKEPKTIEEWASLYPVNFCEPKTNFSEIPNGVLIKYQERLNRIGNKGRYLKKALIYLKNGRLPSYRRVIDAVRMKVSGRYF